MRRRFVGWALVAATAVALGLGSVWVARTDTAASSDPATTTRDEARDDALARASKPVPVERYVLEGVLEGRDAREMTPQDHPPFRDHVAPVLREEFLGQGRFVARLDVRVVEWLEGGAGPHRVTLVAGADWDGRMGVSSDMSLREYQSIEPGRRYRFVVWDDQLFAKPYLQLACALPLDEDDPDSLAEIGFLYRCSPAEF